MSSNDGPSKSLKNGTGHILQDLLSSTVLLQRSIFVPKRPKLQSRFPLKSDDDNSSPEEFKSCSICSESTNLRPLALQEMEILAKFVLSQEQISLILQTEDHPPIFSCKICSSAILSLAKLTTQIENITISLRAVISSRNGLFNKLRKEESAKINDLSGEIAADSELSNSDDDQHLTVEEFTAEEEFSMKVEPTCADDDDITPDPLYQPDTSESDDHDSDFGVDANSNVDADSREHFVCKKCPGHITFSKSCHLTRHMRNKNIHPDLSDAEIAAASEETRRNAPWHECAMCSKIYASPRSKYRHVELIHLSDKTTCPYGCATKIDSEAAWVTHLEGCESPKMIAESDCACPHCPAVLRSLLLQMEHRIRVHPENTYPCPTCEQRFTRKAVLNDHRCATTEEKKKVSNSKPKEVDADSKCVCKICRPNVTFSKYYSYISHMRYKHPDVSDSGIEVSKRIPCKKCRSKFTSNTALLQHMRTAHFHSDQGNVSPSNNSASLTTTEGFKPTRLPCPNCAKSFHTNYALNRHRRAVHEGVPFQRTCNSCPLVFTRLDLWQKHKENCHSALIPSQNLSGSCDT